MDELSVEDLILMLLAQPRDNRNHSNNLELFKTLSERELSGANITFNILSAITLAVFTTIIGTMIQGSGLSLGFYIISGLGIVAGLYAVLRTHAKRKGIRKRYLDLIRLYYYLDAVM